MKAPKLENSRTFKNVRMAFADEAELVFRYLYCATLAEFEGLEKHSALFKEIAESGTCNAHGCLDFLKLAQDPDSEISFGGTLRNLESLVQSETRQHDQTYPEMAKADSPLSGRKKTHNRKGRGFKRGDFSRWA